MSERSRPTAIDREEKTSHPDSKAQQWRYGPCFAKHPETGRLCQGWKRHPGKHWSTGPGYSHRWRSG